MTDKERVAQLEDTLEWLIHWFKKHYLVDHRDDMIKYLELVKHKKITYNVADLRQDLEAFNTSGIANSRSILYEK